MGLLGISYGIYGINLMNYPVKYHHIFPVYVDLLGIYLLAHGSSWDNWKIGGSILFRWIYRDFIYNH